MVAVTWYALVVLLTKEQVMAYDDQCADFQFKSPFLPGEILYTIYLAATGSNSKQLHKFYFVAAKSTSLSIINSWCYIV